ncbi:MAG: N-formylglutamate amidohydrolase [Bdellovibrionales bacterium]|nr:N-formylglutamate amidohydrolase [Bdellovibrionales bacterium]
MREVVNSNSASNESLWIQSFGNGARPLIVTIPHSGERVPLEAPWLLDLPERLLMFDVDRFVDRLYQPTLDRLGIGWIKTEWHRYACDLNRLSTDVDSDSVIGSRNASGKFPRGLLWSMTTKGERLMSAPITDVEFQKILNRCFFPFHSSVEKLAEHVSPKATRRAENPLYHLDLHSMPSFGTREHRDPGEWRADLVISNQDGQSSSADFFKLVCQAGEAQGFSVRQNWPYKGGRITEAYGRPQEGWQTVQVELNRKLYMNEETKRPVPVLFEETQTRVGRVLEYVASHIGDLRA